MSTVESSTAEEAVAEEVQKGEPNAWWTTLKHEGVLLSPPVLEETFSEGPPEILDTQVEKLRRKYKGFKNNPDKLRDWLDIIFEDFLGHSQEKWEKESFVSDEFKYQNLRPNRVLKDDDENPIMAVWIDDDRVTTDDGEPGRIGIYSGRRTYAKLEKLLRSTEIPLGILTNGHQFRLVHATLDRDSWTEWDARAWFEGGEGRQALRGFYGLLGSEELLDEEKEEKNSLLGKIKESRERQADLSDVMGTQVREAVEMLIQELDAILMEAEEDEREEILEALKELDLNQREELRARYQASIRMIMRLVVALYAESRGLFPKDNPVYYESYSVENLFRQLRKVRIEKSEEVLKNQYSGWPRLLALSRLVYHGSPHPEISMQSYGGRLFRPPEEDGEDSVLAALSVFEHEKVRISDATILEILEKLKIAEFRAGGEKRRGPVDFSELRTEYIGMMYEGLLGYDLREATEEDGAIVFLNVGDEPALPFNVLESLDEDGLDNLIDNLKDRSSDSFLSEGKVSESDFEEEELEEESEEDELPEIEVDEDADIDERIHAWARRVVRTTGVYMPHHNTVRAMDPTIREKYEEKAARRLIDRVIRPGGTYLVSYEGTRKSTGTFYTPPRLAIPTVHRTLEPLVYDEVDEEEKVPKTPEEILDLKVCDPAMGSGTFLVGAIEYLTDGLKESFEHHVFPEVEEGEPIAEPFGEQAKGILNERLLSIRKGEDEQWEERLESQLKRLIVERCIYGVDINPLAVELGKLSLWIETMDPDLPFTFLDHKLRVGNSLIGAWLDEFQHYPVAAWNRDGASDERDQRIRDFRNNEMKEQMRNYIRNAQHDTSFFEPGPDPLNLLEKARKVFDELHNSVNSMEREELYHEKFQENEEIQTLRHLMNRWCAVWFWPMDSDDAPILNPETFYNTISDEETDSIVNELANGRKTKFFHWELEFPDVFLGEEWGFDSMLGNPPWEILKPEENEFFTRFRPEFQAYGKKQSKEIKTELFSAYPQIKERWNNYKGFYRGLSNFVKYSNNPWKVRLSRGKKADKLANAWMNIREKDVFSNVSGFPYRYQGSADLNTFKLFAEKFMFLLKKDNGRLGILTPDGLYLGKGTRELRQLFVNNSHWDWLYGFYNKKKLFDIPSQDKFSISIIESGKQTDELKCNFNRIEADTWATHEPNYFLTSRNQINKFSPLHNVIMEVVSQRDIDLLDKIFNSNKIISHDEEINYLREFDTTNDSNYFKWFYRLENDGLTQESPLKWGNKGKTMVPLIQGKAIHHLKFPHQTYTKKDGSRNWNFYPTDRSIFKTKYLVNEEDNIESNKTLNDVKIVYRVTTQPIINPRSMIAAIIPNLPTANSVAVLDIDKSGLDKLMIAGILNSYIFDYIIRFRIPGINLSWFIVEEAPIPEPSSKLKLEISKLVAKLNWNTDFFPSLNEFTNGQLSEVEYVEDPKERAKIKEELDSLVMKSYGLSDKDMKWILRPDSDDPRSLWKDYKERLKLLGGEGKWGELSEEEMKKLEEEEVDE